MTVRPIAETEILLLRDELPPDELRAALAAHGEDAVALLDAWEGQDRALGRLYGADMDEPLPDRYRSLLASGRLHSIGPVATRLQGLRLLAAVLALLSLGAVLGWSIAHPSRPAPLGVDFAAGAIDAHRIFSAEVAHPVEVAADQGVHLATWLTNRLGQPVTPPDLTKQGLRLLGGRVLPGRDGSTAVQMMYQSPQGARLTLYLARQPAIGDTDFQILSSGSLVSLFWRDGSLGCAITASLPVAVLERVAADVYRQLE
ncbi:MAG: anti-sigma factor [Paracoccaceae bacterium]